MKKLLIVGLMLWSCLAFAGPKEDFEALAPFARKCEFWFGVPASIQLAQAFSETNFGRADTIGTLYNNWFAIMAIEGDGWNGPKGKMLGAYKKRVFVWRAYWLPIFSWLDYLLFMHEHASRLLYKPSKAWIADPPKYGASHYWQRIRRNIQRYDLTQYDVR